MWGRGVVECGVWSVELVVRERCGEVGCSPEQRGRVLVVMYVGFEDAALGWMVG